jgi:hypothetical protein
MIYVREVWRIGMPAMIWFSGKPRFQIPSRCALYRNVELEPALPIVRRNGQAKG